MEVYKGENLDISLFSIIDVEIIKKNKKLRNLMVRAYLEFKTRKIINYKVGIVRVSFIPLFENDVIFLMHIKNKHVQDEYIIANKLLNDFEHNTVEKHDLQTIEVNYLDWIEEAMAVMEDILYIGANRDLRPNTPVKNNLTDYIQI